MGDPERERAKVQALIAAYEPASRAAMIASRARMHRPREEREEAVRAAFLAECQVLGLPPPPPGSQVIGVTLDRASSADTGEEGP